MRGKKLQPGRFVVDGVRVQFLDAQVRFHWEGLAIRGILDLPRAVRWADVLHVSGTRHFLGLIAEATARRSSTPFVVMPEGSIPPRFRNIAAKKTLDAIYTRRSLANAFRVIATSESEAKDLQRWGIPRQRTVTLPPRSDQIEVSSRPTAELRRVWDVPMDAPVLLWIGRIHPEKGLPLLFEALEDDRLGSTHLLLGGESESPDLLKQLGKHGELRLRGRVRFLGWVSHEQKAELFKLANLFVLPSRKENFGLAAAEAVSSGLPAVVTEGCGVAKIIDGKAGLACAYDPAALADTLATLLCDKEELARMASGTAEVARRLDWPPLVKYLEDMYREAIASR